MYSESLLFLLLVGVRVASHVICIHLKVLQDGLIYAIMPFSIYYIPYCYYYVIFHIQFIMQLPMVNFMLTDNVIGGL